MASSVHGSKPLLQKTFLVLLMVLATTCFISKFLVDSYYLDHRPRELRTEEGRVYSQYIKVAYGDTVFLTRKEQLLSESLLPMFFGIISLGYWLNSRWKHFAPFKKEKFSVNITTKRSDDDKG